MTQQCGHIIEQNAYTDIRKSNVQEKMRVINDDKLKLSSFKERKLQTYHVLSRRLFQMKYIWN